MDNFNWEDMVYSRLDEELLERKIEDKTYMQLRADVVQKEKRVMDCDLSEKERYEIECFISAKNAMWSRYSELAYQLGFQDCRSLLMYLIGTK